MSSGVPTVLADAGVETQLVARTPQEMEVAQAGLVEFFKHKAGVARAEASEAADNQNLAVEAGIKATPFDRLRRKLVKRAEYYERALAAVQAGHVLMPNVPIRAFAVRVVREQPRFKKSTTAWDASRTQSDCPPAGEGRYVDEQSHYYERQVVTERDEAGNVKRSYYEFWPTEYDESIDFPLTAAKPVVLSQCTAAMRDLIFDELGVVSEQAKGDPIVVGRIYDPTHRYRERCMTFLISWYVDLRDL